MGENFVNIALGLLAAAALSAVIMLVQKRKNRDAWSGTVAAIERVPARHDDDREYISIKYIRDDGELRSFECDASSYPFWFKDLQPGDRLIKPAGAGVPQRVAAPR
jgi:hypothetical protein